MTIILRDEGEPGRVPSRKNGALAVRNGAISSPRGTCCRTCTCGPHNYYTNGPGEPPLLSRMSFTSSGESGVGVQIATTASDAGAYCTYPGYGGPWYSSLLWPNFPYNAEGFCTVVYFFSASHTDTTSSFWTSLPPAGATSCDWSTATENYKTITLSVAVEVVCDSSAPPETWTVFAAVNSSVVKVWDVQCQFGQTQAGESGCFAKIYRWNGVQPSQFISGAFDLSLSTQNADDSICVPHQNGLGGPACGGSSIPCARAPLGPYFPYTPNGDWNLSFQILP